ncbi:serine hydrolase domain-containing protein [Deinococcus radiotolerans]|uniref:Penicillin-binding protein n=1 Tax=Deinococcus radiotolerans TaxID=1309407 RepID=A0ABQ2FQU2_9DEIO|nr:serine hydrolase domain-containing protein [Deinococcus radiotolerans]GGL17949.1 penicillin-binding protein [Deinococcus radiotolerans]
MTAPTTPAIPTDLAEQFEHEARRLLGELGIPGVTLGLLTPDGNHFVSLGVTSLENPLPVTSETLFQIGSTTKTLTSLTLSVLEAQGKLKLDDPVRTHLPDFRLRDESVAAALTVRDLLTHQGGFQGDLFEDTGDGNDAVARVVDFMAGVQQMVPLRGHWSYNNAGFYVAGRVIEVLSGMTYDAAVTELVLRPLGMDATLFSANQIMTHRFAAGHNKIGDGMAVQRPWMMMRSAAPAGSTCSSTVQDMARYAHYIMSGTVSGPSSEPVAEETQSAPAALLAALDRSTLWAHTVPTGLSLNGFPGTLGEMGQSWFVDRPSGTLILSHGGTTHGQQSDFWVAPDLNVAFIAMTNASNGHALHRRLSDWVKREVLGLTAPTLEAYALPPGQMQALAGEYAVFGLPVSVTVRAENGGLTLMLPTMTDEAPERAALRLIGPDRAVIVGGDTDGFGVEFLPGADGQVEFLRLGGRLYPRAAQSV